MIDLKALAAPFPPEKISWRVGSTNADKSRGMALAYIDARDVMDRLNDVCGPWWQCRYPHANGKTICEIGLKIGDEWIWRADGAGDTDVEAEKGAISDAFKRAAVKWGVGKYLYDLESPWVELEPAGRSYKIKAGEHAKLRAVLTKSSPVAQQEERPRQAAGSSPAGGAKSIKGFHLVEPRTGKVRVVEKGSTFLDELEIALRGSGDAVSWWALNGPTALLIAEKFPQAKKRVEALQQLAMLPA